MINNFLINIEPFLNESNMIKKDKKNNEREIIIADLERKVDRLKETLESYKKELKILTICKTERRIYCDLSTIFASAESFDDLLKRTMQVLLQQLKARYCGYFLLDDEKDKFEYCYGKGYKPGPMPAVPRVGSVMGKCLFERDIMWIPDVRTREDCIPLNQEPAEYNILCAPMILNKEDRGVIRLSNIDADLQEMGVELLKSVNPLLCTSLERMQLQHQSEQAVRGLDASFTIARLLEKTLAEVDILKKVCAHIPKLISCKACILAVKSGDDIKSAFSWPENFYLGGNPQSNTIYLRNLLEAFPEGSALIDNVHKDRRWAWPERDVRSLCMAGLHLHGVLKGLLIALSPNNEIYKATQQNLLGLVAAQTSITLERASYFRKQEELASCDGLTGLLNHRMFQESIRFEIERAKRYNHALSLVMFDIDHFKKFNDRYGHPVGDEVLKMVSFTIKGLIRITDRVFRYGGEEFCLLLPETTAKNAVNLADRLRKKIEANRAVRELSVTISLGITEYKMQEPPEDFINRTDSMLYKSKENGRNRVTVG